MNKGVIEKDTKDTVRDHYYNPHSKKEKYPKFSSFLRWQLGCYKDPIAEAPPPSHFAYPNPHESVPQDARKVTWVNHTTYYIEAYGKTFLTDPIWSERCSPFPFFGPKRQHPAEPPLEDIKKVDYVIISHDHYDHLDKKTVRALNRRFPEIRWIVPFGVKSPLQKLIGKADIIELKWTEKYEDQDWTFTAVAAQHFSGRRLWNRNQTLWMGCVVEYKKRSRFYFAGDTGYNRFDFKRIGDMFGKMDLSIIPIGSYTPRDFMSPIHINPAESVAIHQETHSELSVASHWKTFKLSDESADRPPYDLYCALEQKEIPFSAFRVLDPGQTIAW